MSFLFNYSDMINDKRQFYSNHQTEFFLRFLLTSSSEINVYKHIQSQLYCRHRLVVFMCVFVSYKCKDNTAWKTEHTPASKQTEETLMAQAECCHSRPSFLCPGRSFLYFCACFSNNQRQAKSYNLCTISIQQIQRSPCVQCVRQLVVTV